jgi:hypothetical protein|tara:strand:+ start:413 stop:634 length:222 start_codon:yes stop_codon:yes gene_type:complete
MLSNISNVVRSNQNAVMLRVGTTSSAVYTIFDIKSQTNTYTGTLNACKKAWNKHYRNSRQFVTRNGSNHRYMG